MTRLPAVKPRELERILLHAGFAFDRQRGSHRVYRRASDGRTVTIPWHPRDIKRTLLFGILRQAGMTVQEFLKRR